MNTLAKPYIDFIRYSIGVGEKVPPSSKDIDWSAFLEYCNRQGIIGLVFGGLQKSDLRIPQTMLFEWIGFGESIKQQNASLNKRINQIVRFFNDKGYRACVLKGQANGQMYPEPELRSPGDIDVWVEGKETEIIRLVQSVTPDTHYSIHHIKFPIFKDVSVEVHYRPMYLNDWFKDKKLQRYISSIEKRQFDNRLPIGEKKIGCLTSDFDVIYQILHMHAHFFSTRNNWKQFIDYYYLLKKAHADNTDLKDTADKFKDLGIYKYASGIMWIMSDVLGLERGLLPVDPNEKEGRMILRESEYFGAWSTNKLWSVVEQFVANFRIVTHYPKEVLISPLFLIWHQWWKVKMWWKLNMRSGDWSVMIHGS